MMRFLSFIAYRLAHCALAPYATAMTLCGEDVNYGCIRTTRFYCKK